MELVSEQYRGHFSGISVPLQKITKANIKMNAQISGYKYMEFYNIFFALY